MLRAAKLRDNFQTYPDGWGCVMNVIDRQLVSVKDPVVHFAEATVGERRFWDAQVNGVAITRAVRVPLAVSVNQGDIFEIDGTQYEVVQKDRRDDRTPSSWLLSLQRAVIKYRRADGQKDRA